MSEQSSEDIFLVMGNLIEKISKIEKLEFYITEESNTFREYKLYSPKNFDQYVKIKISCESSSEVKWKFSSDSDEELHDKLMSLITKSNNKQQLLN